MASKGGDEIPQADLVIDIQKSEDEFSVLLHCL
jgi:hypothetical protein